MLVLDNQHLMLRIFQRDLACPGRIKVSVVLLLGFWRDIPFLWLRITVFPRGRIILISKLILILIKIVPFSIPGSHPSCVRKCVLLSAMTTPICASTISKLGGGEQYNEPSKYQQGNKKPQER